MTLGLGREERIDGLRSRLFVHAAAVVLNGHFDEFLWVSFGIAFAPQTVPGHDNHLAVSTHRIAGIRGQIDQSDLKLGAIAARFPEIFVAGDEKLRVSSEDALDDRTAPRQQLPDIMGNSPDPLATCEQGQTLGEGLPVLQSATAFAKNQCPTLFADLSTFQEVKQRLESRADVIEIVNDGPGYRTQRLQLLAVNQALVEAVDLADVAGRTQDPGE